MVDIWSTGILSLEMLDVRTLLEKFWRISLYLTDNAIAKLYVT